MSHLLVEAAVPAFKCPANTKLHILNLGFCEEATPVQRVHRIRRTGVCDLMVIAGLLEHPDFGLILFETGCAENLEIKWGAPLTDVFPRTVYTDEMKLPAAIKATGNDIKDVKAVIMGHLHLDHAGGLEHFMDSKPIYVHEEEFKHACWAVGTGADLGVYLGDYMDLQRLNWQTFTEDHYDLCQGVTLHHLPGHTPGLCGMQVNLSNDETFIFTTDQYHVCENHAAQHPQGWLARDHNRWVRSHRLIQQLERLFKARLIFGHDKEVAEKFINEKRYFE